MKIVFDSKKGPVLASKYGYGGGYGRGRGKGRKNKH